MNYSVVPDFIAIGGLVAVFHSLLRRTRETRLRYWLVGWVMLLIHIAAQFVAQNLEADAPIAVAVSLSMLLLASVAFIWAGRDSRDIGSRSLVLTLIGAAPEIAVIVCAVYGVAALWAYMPLTAAGLASSLWMFRGGQRVSDRRLRVLRTAAIVAAYLVQGVLLYRRQWELVIVWMLCWHYLAVALCFRLSAPRPTAGVVFTTLSFIAWALVFPAGFALHALAPGIHVEAEVWNLPKFLVATGMIFTLLEEQLSRAEYASQHDELTGLPNRRLFSRRLRHALRVAQERGQQLALLVMDLDNFKLINDSLGHAVGDELLQHMARQCRAHLRSGDTLARLGGDEFAVILADVADRGAARVVVQELRSALAVPAIVQGHTLSVDASIGLSMYPVDALEETLLYAVADRAMYGDKQTRRDDGELLAAR